MFKRVMLALTFVAAISVAGLGITKTAEARHGCSRGYGGGYHAVYYPSWSHGYGHYGGFGHSYYAPRRSFYYGDHYGRHGGLHFSIGF